MTVGTNDRWLVLWDIDHTLIETSGLGSELYLRAFETVTGESMKQQADVTGQTEPSILTATLRLHGIEEDEPYLSRYKEVLSDLYKRHLDELRDRGRTLPGARTALATAAGDSSAVQSVLSGNLRSVAETKLRAFGLDQYVDLSVGAYGDDDSDRPKLVGIAQQRAGEKYELPFSRANTVVVGDSTQDIITAQRGGASSIGVASGKESINDLKGAGADIVLADLNGGALKEAITRLRESMNGGSD